MEGRDLRKYTAVPYHSARMTAPTTVERRPQRRTAPTVPHRDNLKAIIFDKGTNAYYNTEPYTFSTDGDCLDTEVFSYTAESFGFHVLLASLKNQLFRLSISPPTAHPLPPRPPSFSLGNMMAKCIHYTAAWSHWANIRL